MIEDLVFSWWFWVFVVGAALSICVLKSLTVEDWRRTYIALVFLFMAVIGVMIVKSAIGASDLYFALATVIGVLMGGTGTVLFFVVALIDEEDLKKW